MDSYDRLFPSQDTMPRGGFGNLIALPLQHEPRQAGNSVFLDDELEAVPRRPAVGVPRLRAAHRSVDGRADRARGDARGIASSAFAARRRSTRRTRHRGRASLPGSRRRSASPSRCRRRCARVLAQRLFVEKAGLPSPLLNQIKRLAAFQNPEFYKKQSMRLSTAMTPRVIACAEDLPQHVALPRGCQADLEELLREHGVALDVEDERVSGEPLELRFQGQADAGPGAGRDARSSRTTSACSSRRPASARPSSARTSWRRAAAARLVLVHRRPLLDQWLAQLSLFLGIEPKEIGQIGAGKKTGERPARRRDDPEPRSQGDGRTTSSRATARSSSTSATTSRRSRSSACSRR